MLTLRRTARSRNPALLGQTVVVIAGSAGIGLEIACHARTAGADVVLTGSDPAQVAQAALEVGAERTAAFDPRDQVALKAFFDVMPGSIDHVVLTAAGDTLALDVARDAAGRIKPGGTLMLIGDPGPFAAALSAALAPVRVRVELIERGLVDTLRIGDVATAALDVMASKTLSGAIHDIDGGRRLPARAV